jgi:hypothetical protein
MPVEQQEYDVVARFGSGSSPRWIITRGLGLRLNLGVLHHALALILNYCPFLQRFSAACYCLKFSAFFQRTRDSSTMAASIKIGQRLEGKVGSYFISAQVAKDIWIAT